MGRGGSVVGFGAFRHEGRRFSSFTRSCLLRFGVLTSAQYQCCSREHLGVVDLKGLYRNIRNDWIIDWLIELSFMTRRALPPCPLSSCAGCRTLWSSVQGNLMDPFAHSATMQTCYFSVIGPTTWIGLPTDLGHLRNGACSHFWRLTSEDCSFPLGLGQERLWVGMLKGRYINFNWLIDWFR